jgi:hypothetical protein
MELQYHRADPLEFQNAGRRTVENALVHTYWVLCGIFDYYACCYIRARWVAVRHPALLWRMAGHPLISNPRILTLNEW